MTLYYLHLGGSMQQDGIAVAASSISIFIVTSIFFSIFGCLCGLHHRKRTQNSPSAANQPAPVYYEDVHPKDCKQKFELQSNIAYAPITK